ncbi:unnamed protein product [Effrenium voratum]|uniref:Uncharacterized protein n=1 Tax=Effrenium voratum TaxID=2562239 RepID=A0AA36JCA4_9DINO|nr:unnamed protein product [Effrenium voratum]CAJ1403046.1 unnamed protein product [Effrenium voratum]CAJ1431075.1 unnamed protein product [Effrenium voratum]
MPALPVHHRALGGVLRECFAPEHHCKRGARGPLVPEPEPAFPQHVHHVLQLW